MNLTLLLDLDDTLLDSKVDTFIPVYFQALSGFLKDQVEPELMLSALMSGTHKMMASNDASRRGAKPLTKFAQRLRNSSHRRTAPGCGRPRT